MVSWLPVPHPAIAALTRVTQRHTHILILFLFLLLLHSNVRMYTFLSIICSFILCLGRLETTRSVDRVKYLVLSALAKNNSHVVLAFLNMSRVLMYLDKYQTYIF